MLLHRIAGRGSSRGFTPHCVASPSIFVLHVAAALLGILFTSTSASARPDSPKSGSISLWFGNRQVASAVPAVFTHSGEVFAPVLDPLNGAAGSTLAYRPDRSDVSGSSGDGSAITIPLAPSMLEGERSHRAFLLDGQVYVPLQALSRIMGNAYSWNGRLHRATLCPRLSSISVAPAEGTVRVQLHSSAPLGFIKVSYYDSPWRIVLDVNGARSRAGRQRCSVPGVAEVRWKEWPTPGKVRIVIELKDQLPFKIADSGRTNDYWLDVLETDRTGATGSVVASVPGLSPEAPAFGSPAPGGSSPVHSVRLPEAGAGAIPPAPIPSSILPPAPVAAPPGSNPAVAAGEAGAGDPTVRETPHVPENSVGRSPITPDTAPSVETHGVVESITAQTIAAGATEVTVTAAGALECHPSYQENPARLNLDLPGAALKVANLSPDLSGPGLSRVETSSSGSGSRIVLQLSDRTLFRVWSEQNRSVLKILLKDSSAVGWRFSPAAGSLRDKVICIDPGHCSVFHGCRGFDGLREEVVALDVAQRLADLLSNAGATVLMTRTTQDAPSGGGRGLLADLVSRADLANRHHADLFLSIHCNAMPNGMHGHGHGSLAIYSHPRSKRWASEVLGALTRTMGHGGDGLSYRPHIKVTEKSNMPAALAELGFLDTRADADLLADPAFRQKEAESLFQAFQHYFNHSSTAPDWPDVGSEEDPATPIPVTPVPVTERMASRSANYHHHGNHHRN